jgi:hypothetical protein
VAFIDGVAIRAWCCPRNESNGRQLFLYFWLYKSGSVHGLDPASVPCRLAALIDGVIREALPNLDYSGREWVYLSRIIQMRICDDRISA